MHYGDRFGHPLAIWTLDYSPDGMLLAVAGFTGIVRFWDVSELDPKFVAEFSPHGRPVTSLSFSPKGTVLATAGGDRTVRLSNVDDVIGAYVRQDYNEIDAVQDQIKVIPHDSYVVSVAFSPDGTMLATASGTARVRVFDANGEEIARSPEREGVAERTVAFRSDGKILASSNADRTLRLWDLTPLFPRAPADFDGDGVVGFSDFLLFAEAFGVLPAAPLFDLDGDGAVTFADFVLFAAVFAK